MTATHESALRELAGLSEKATPGPMVSEKDEGCGHHRLMVGLARSAIQVGQVYAWEGEHWELETEATANAQFIAAAVNWTRGHAPALLAELAGLRKDAERYRWLRQFVTVSSVKQFMDWQDHPAKFPGDLDAAIDAARQGGA